MGAVQDRPWLSVLVPVHNVAPYLRACVESVLQQADAGVEVVLRDDCSTDGSADLMQQLNAEHGGRLRLLQAERNLGISGTRNALLEASRGEWIWFLDSDDFLMPGAIPALRQCVQAEALDLVLCDFRDVREQRSLKHRLRREQHRRTHNLPARQPCSDRSALMSGLFLQGHMHVWSKIARRRLWGDDLRFPVGRYFEDMALAPHLLLRARSALYVPEVWVGYRKRPGSIMASISAHKVDDMQDALNGLTDALRAAQPPLRQEALLAAAHFVAKTYVAASQFAARGQDPTRLARYLQQFERNAPASAAALLRFYASKAWFWRALRLRHWIQRGRKAATQSPPLA